MRLAGPGLLKLWPKGDDQQDRQPARAVDRQVEQFARGRVDPVGVLEDHQNGLAPRDGFELTQQCFEQHLTLALRAEIKVGDGVRQ